MDNIFIVNDVVDLTGVTTLSEALAALNPGELLAVGDGVNFTATAFNTGVNEVQFFTRLKNGDLHCSVPIRRTNITRVNTQTAVAGQKRVVRIGGTGVGAGLVIPSTGEGNITFRNLSYNHAIPTQRVNFSFNKRATETPSAFLDRVVTEINNTMALQAKAFISATKLGVTDFALQFTTSDPFVDLSIQLDGIFEGYEVVEIQALILPIGRGEDILAVELELTKHLGNHGYAELNDLWYKGQLQADPSLNYDVVTLNWRGIGETPTSAMQVASNTLQFATPTTEGNLAPIAALINAAGGFSAIVDVDSDATDGFKEEA